MPHHPLTPAAGRPPVTHPATRHLVYRQCRRSAALAAGVEAMAARAMDNGEATHDQLEQLAELSGELLERLDHMSAALAEMATAPHDDETSRLA